MFVTFLCNPFIVYIGCFLSLPRVLMSQADLLKLGFTSAEATNLMWERWHHLSCLLTNSLKITNTDSKFYLYCCIRCVVAILYFIGETLKELLALAVYDTILTFPREVRCIWQRKLGMGPVLYLLIRYGTVLHMLCEILSGFPTARSIIVGYTLHDIFSLIDLVCI